MKSYIDEQGRFRIGSLFYELRKGDWIPVWTVKEQPFLAPDGKIYPSLKASYMSYDHVPNHEYNFAMEQLGSWKHWLVLCASGALKDMIQEWRDELTIKLKSEAIRKLMTMQDNEGTIGLNANKYIADEAYLPKKAGRMSKAEKERANKIDARITQELHEDMTRLGMSMISGGKK
jgi:hypothetical protein